MAKTEALAKREVSALDKLRERPSEAVESQSFDEMMEQLTAENALLIAREEFNLVNREAKEKLIGVPILIFSWVKRDGDFGEYYSVKARTVTNELVIINDGSTGIAAQMQWLDDHDEKRAIFCKDGLRASDYTVVLPNGKELESRTYYLTPDPTNGGYRDIKVTHVKHDGE